MIACWKNTCWPKCLMLQTPVSAQTLFCHQKQSYFHGWLCGNYDGLSKFERDLLCGAPATFIDVNKFNKAINHCMPQHATTDPALNIVLSNNALPFSHQTAQEFCEQSHHSETSPTVMDERVWPFWGELIENFIIGNLMNRALVTTHQLELLPNACSLTFSFPRHIKNTQSLQHGQH